MNTFNGIHQDTLSFLADLEENNSKAWFDANKKRYQQSFVEPAKKIVIALGEQLNQLSEEIHAEPRINGSIFRINRDVRFSQDKTPYKPHLDLMFWQGEGRGREQSAYFFRLTPSSLTLGAGKPAFTKEELERYRSAVDSTAGATLSSLLETLREDGYRPEGTHYKRTPKGYPQDHEHAALLKHNSLHAWIDLGIPEELQTSAFPALCFKHFQELAPLQEWLIEHVVS